MSKGENNKTSCQSFDYSFIQVLQDSERHSGVRLYTRINILPFFLTLMSCHRYYLASDKSNSCLALEVVKAENWDKLWKENTCLRLFINEIHWIQTCSLFIQYFWGRVINYKSVSYRQFYRWKYPRGYNLLFYLTDWILLWIAETQITSKNQKKKL